MTKAGSKKSSVAKQKNRRASSLASRLRRVRLLLTDVDGVLTDGSVFITADGEFKQFNIQDGLGLRLLQKSGIKVGWISNRSSSATRQRAEELKVDFLFQEPGNKVEVIESILSKAGLTWKDASFMGDDVVDLGGLKRAGVAIAVANAIAEAKALAHYVTTARGGEGAVREAVELILKAQGKWTPLVRQFSS